MKCEELRPFWQAPELTDRERCQIAAHFLECDTCQSKAQAVGLYPGGHLNEEDIQRLSDSNDGEDEAEIERMSSHLSVCAECALAYALEKAQDPLTFAEMEDSTPEEIDEVAQNNWPYLRWSANKGYTASS